MRRGTLLGHLERWLGREELPAAVAESLESLDRRVCVAACRSGRA